MIVQARDRAGNVFARHEVAGVREAFELAMTWATANPPALEIVGAWDAEALAVGTSADTAPGLPNKGGAATWGLTRGPAPASLDKGKG
jgi:hypothetical protein